jgi:hypothetical protein
LGELLLEIFRVLPDADKKRISDRIGMRPGTGFEEQISILLKNIDELASSGMMKVDKNYLASLRKYRSIITFVHDFYWSMRRNNAKDTRFDNEKLRRLLEATGALDGTW